METRTCKICGQEKPAEAFSKSYPKRCRECVATEARERRKAKTDKGLLTYEGEPQEAWLLPDFLRPAAQEDKWEARHYELALCLFHRYFEDYGDPAEAAKFAKDAADKFINIMQDSDQ